MPIINNFPVVISTTPSLMIAPSSCIIIGGIHNATNTNELSEAASNIPSLNTEQEA